MLRAPDPLSGFLHGESLGTFQSHIPVPHSSPTHIPVPHSSPTFQSHIPVPRSSPTFQSHVPVTRCCPIYIHVFPCLFTPSGCAANYRRSAAMCVQCPANSLTTIGRGETTCTCQSNRSTSTGNTMTSGDACDGEWTGYIDT